MGDHEQRTDEEESKIREDRKLKIVNSINNCIQSMNLEEVELLYKLVINIKEANSIHRFIRNML